MADIVKLDNVCHILRHFSDGRDLDVDTALLAYLHKSAVKIWLTHVLNV